VKTPQVSEKQNRAPAAVSVRHQDVGRSPRWRLGGELDPFDTARRA
jgi:hypothetical protein